jgi:hypothetical protein
MPIKEWSRPEEFVADLRKCRWEEHFRKKHLEESHSDWQAIIRNWVGPNTFRAFRNMPQKPSVVFRDWAKDALLGKEHRLASLQKICSPDEYDRWMVALGRSLRRRWEAKMEEEMGYGHSMKLPNLLMKGICVSPDLPRSVADRLVWHLHVPLDSFSIRAVRHCVRGSAVESVIGRVKASAAMGDVKTGEVYDGFQKLMRSLAGRANVPPIAIDILTWDGAHRPGSIRNKS